MKSESIILREAAMAEREEFWAGLPSQKLDVPITDVHLEEIGASILNWKGLRAYLGLTKPEEEAIDNDNRSTERKRVALLQKWQEKQGVRATYRNLVQIFCDAGRRNLVQVVCELLGGQPVRPFENQQLDATGHCNQAGLSSEETVGSSVLGEQDLREITRYLEPLLKSDVTRLGVEMGLRYPWLVDRENSHNFRYEVVSAWLRRQDSVADVCPPTWHNFVSALRKINQNGIASKVVADKNLRT